METKRCYGCMQPAVDAPFCPHCGYPANGNNESHHLNVGTLLLDRYLVGKVLGQGGFGITYLGWDQTEDCPVAIKEYYPASQVTRDTARSNHVHCYTDNLTTAYHTSKERFLREARALSQLGDIPAIVRVRECFEENNTVYIVMEYVRGTDLRGYIAMRGQPLSLRETLAILRPVLDALAAVHQRGLVHRDISPDNIMLHPTRGAVLLDFGAVRDVSGADVNTPLTKSTEAILKHGFAPLEQYRSRGSLGPWTDIYALCATIYYCLTGKVPPEALARMMGEEVLDWSCVGDLSDEQRSALEKGMAVMAKERFVSVEPLRQALYPTPKPDPVPVPELPRKEEAKPDHRDLRHDPVSAFRPKKLRTVLVSCIIFLFILSGAAIAIFSGSSSRDERDQLSGSRENSREDSSLPTVPDIPDLPAAEPEETPFPETEEPSAPETEEPPAENPASTEPDGAIVESERTYLPEEQWIDMPITMRSVYYSYSGNIAEIGIDCNWGRLPINIPFPESVGFSAETTRVQLTDHTGEDLPLESWHFTFCWEGSTAQVHVPDGLPEGVYHINFYHGNDFLDYVICVGTSGNYYPVEEDQHPWGASIYHDASQLYLRNDGKELKMTGVNDSTSFQNRNDIFKISYEGSVPVPSATGKYVSIDLQQMFFFGSNAREVYLLHWDGYYLAYNTAKGLHLTTQLSADCHWSLVWN